MLMRGPAGRAVFGTQCSQVRWQLPPMTSRSPWPRSCRTAVAAAVRTQQQRARIADATTIATMVSSVRCARCGRRARRRCRGRRGTGTAQPSRTARRARRRSARRARAFISTEHRIGQRRAFVVEREQPRYVHDALVHLPPLGAPRHAVAQPLEQRVRAVQPARGSCRSTRRRSTRCGHRGQRAERFGHVHVEQRRPGRRAACAAYAMYRTYVRFRTTRRRLDA